MAHPPADQAAEATPRARFRLTTTHLFLLLPWVGIVLAARQPIRDNSFLWHVEAGRLQNASGEVLRTDPFSFTAVGESWRTQSWLLDIAYDAMQGLGDLTWVPLYIGLVVFLTIVFALRSVHAATGDLLTTGLVGAGIIWIGVPFLSPRPVLVSYLLIAVMAWVVESPRRRWAIPVIMWFWASVHGSFVLGLGLLVLDGLRRRDRSRAVDVAVGSVAATLTAHGVAIWGVLLAFLANREALDLIQEWQPPDIFEPFFLPYAAAIALLIAGASRGLLPRRDLWVVLPFLLFGLTASRAIFPAFIVLAPWLAVALQSLLPTFRPSGPSTGPLALANAIIAVSIVGLPFLLQSDGAVLNDERFPLEAATTLAPVPTFHDDVVGGYLIYAQTLPGGVFVDDRAELFGAEMLGDIVNIRHGHPSWSEVFERHDIAQALVGVESGIAEVLRAEGWTLIHEDEFFVVYRQ